MKYILIILLILSSLSLYKNKIYAQNINFNKLTFKEWIDYQLKEGLNSYHIAGATFILMQGDSILHMNGFGMADIETNTPVNSTSSIFETGSVSKTFVATAIMQLYETGKVKLDNDVNNYLKTFQLAYKFKDSVTIRDLLTHTAGFDERNIGKLVCTEKEVISLAEYLKKSMPPQIRPAREALTYSNHGYALLGLIVEEVSGLPFYEYVKKMILKPLKMNSSGFKRQPELKKNYAASYLQKDNQLIPFKPGFILDYPAGSFSSTASDMGHYISMFLNYGKYQGVQILDSTTVVKMYQTAFKHYKKSGVGWLPGFYESYWNGFRIVEHAGDYQGFDSELKLIPEKNLGLFICVNTSNTTNSTSRDFINTFIHQLFGMLIPTNFKEKKNDSTPPNIGSVDEPLKAFSGTYRFTRYAQTTLEKFAVLIGFAPEIEIVSKDSTLELLEWKDKLFPVSDLTFYSNYDKYLAFGRNSKGEISYFFDNTNSYQKLKWFEPVKFQIYWMGGVILILLIFIIVSIVGKLYFDNLQGHLINKINLSLASLIILFLAMLAFVLIMTDPSEFLYGIPWLLKFALLLPFIIIPLEVTSIYLWFKAFRYKELGSLTLIYQSAPVVAALAFIPWLMYYNFIGFNY